MNKIVLVDFAGTLVKLSFIKKACDFRDKVLKKGTSTLFEHANSEELYKNNRNFVKKLTGIHEDFKINYRTNSLDFITLNGSQVLNQISTNLFLMGACSVSKDLGQEIYENGFIKELKRIKKLGYKLALITGVRTDIVSSIFEITGIESNFFDYLYGQPPILGKENQKKDVEDLLTKGEVMYTIGDKTDDLKRINVGKKIFVTWGTPKGGEEELADYVIKKPVELRNIIK